MVRLVVATLVALACAASARADVILELERTSISSVDSLRLRVDNEDSLEIVKFDLTLGDFSYNFDSARVDSITGAVDITLVSPDEINEGVRSNALVWTFDGFGLDEHFRTTIDLDRDTGSQTVDWQTVLINSGGANALWKIWWADGRSSSIILPDDPGRDPFEPYLARMSIPQASAVPEPSSIVLLGLGGLGLVAVAQCKKRS